MNILSSEFVKNLIEMERQIDDIGHRMYRDILKYDWEDESDDMYKVKFGGFAYKKAFVTKYYLILQFSTYSNEMDITIPLDEIIGVDVDEYVKKRFEASKDFVGKRYAAINTIREFVKSFGNSVLDERLYID